MKNKNTKLKCQMTENCDHSVTHIDVKGFIYCKEHGHSRKTTMRCRQIKNKELKTLQSGKPIAKY